MNYSLFLDDVRWPNEVTWVQLPQPEKWVIARNYREFVKTVEHLGVPSFVTFDHDLADQHYAAMVAETQGKTGDYGQEKTGYDCAKWLIDYCMDHQTPFPQYAVHSMNPVGAQNISSYIENAKRFYQSAK